MKNKILIGLLITTLSMGTYTISVNADNSSGNSEAQITFELDEDGGDIPVNPIDPTDPTDPGDVDPLPNKGSLILTGIPKMLGFENQKIGKGMQTYQSTVLKPNVQLQDKRGALSTGWNLEVELSDFTSGTDKIPGVLTFKDTKMAQSNTPEQTPPTLIQSDVVVESGQGATTIATASSQEGLGHWIFYWYASEGENLNENVTLQMDSNLAKNMEYKAVLDWTLSVTP